MSDETQFDDAAAEELLRFFQAAIGEALRTEDGEAFLGWVRREGPAGAPSLFAAAEDEEARAALADAMGRSFWNSLPLPGNGFRPRPFPRPERNDPCPCGSGLKYKKCCALREDAVPELEPDSVWMLLVEQLSQEQMEALGESGRLPRELQGELATNLLDDGDAEKALALVRPLFRKPERLDERDAASLNALLEAYEDLDLDEERWDEAERLSIALKGPLRAVLWEHLTRAYAVAGEMEAAWKSLERATEDDPDSPALGPLEVSLLLAEGRTDEARDRAVHWRQRLGEGLADPGRDLLDRVAADPEETQLQFSIGEEATARLRTLQKWLADAPAPEGTYGIEAAADEAGAGRLVTPAGLEPLEAKFEGAFYPPVYEDPELEPADEDDWDPWDEERAGEWLGFLLENPRALDSVDVLEDVAHALSNLVTERFPFLEQPILKPLLDRGITILRRALEAHPEVTRLPGDVEPNGSALALVIAAIGQAHRLGDAGRVEELWTWLRGLEPRTEEAAARMMEEDDEEN